MHIEYNFLYFRGVCGSLLQNFHIVNIWNRSTKQRMTRQFGSFFVVFAACHIVLMLLDTYLVNSTAPSYFGFSLDVSLVIHCCHLQKLSSVLSPWWVIDRPFYRVKRQKTKQLGFEKVSDSLIVKDCAIFLIKEKREKQKKKKKKKKESNTQKMKTAQSLYNGPVGDSADSLLRNGRPFSLKNTWYRMLMQT